MTINESELKANAQWLSRHLKQFGWQYIVVDEGWYLKNPGASACSELQFTLSNDGRYLPASNRFPSSVEGAGFKPLADYAHSLGLKFGLHIVHGIPREAVAKNLPIADSSFRAVDAANLSDTCPWDCHN